MGILILMGRPMDLKEGARGKGYVVGGLFKSLSSWGTYERLEGESGVGDEEKGLGGRKGDRG